MRLRFFSLGIVFALALIVSAGCGGGEKQDPATPTGEAGSAGNSENGGAARALYPYEKVVQQFLVEAGKGNSQGAFALVTPVAQKAYADAQMDFEAKLFQGTVNRITGSAPLQEGSDEYFGIYVDITASEVTPPLQFETVWGVRRVGNEYRIANIMVNLDENAEEVVHLNFEDPIGTRLALEGPQEPAQQAPQGAVMQQQIPQQGTVMQQQMQAPQMQIPQQQMALPTTPNFQ